MADLLNRNPGVADIGDDYESKYGFHDPEDLLLKGSKGLSHDVVEMISRLKKEPEWMRTYRHEALNIFLSKPMPKWGDTALLNSIDFDDIYYYIRPEENKG
ncbi:MAG TPA: Fe-S cluster assembly protein SufB, partial [candidate division Zixibacteria bacterium]|nr:Fe-S cluster assembly protein SufB [candidate division Zixibacteria bacterium]